MKRKKIFPQWLSERRCVSCLEPFCPDTHPSSPEDRFLCRKCRGQMKKRAAGFCPYCGEIYALEDAPCMPCGSCLQKLPPWSDFFFYGVHDGLLRELILRAKFGGSLPIMEFLGHILAGLCEEHYSVTVRPDALVPIPLHEASLRRRGFSQCFEMARSVQKLTGIPVRPELLEKTMQTRSQVEMGREERLELKQVFRAPYRVDGMRLLLFDDVCTTGATLRRAAECLLAAGAEKADVAVLARTPREIPPS